MNDVSLVNFAIVFALVPICQGVVQLLKNDNFSSYIVRLLSLIVAETLVFLVRQANVEGFSGSLQNPYLAGLTGLIVALIAAGLYDSQKAGIVKQIAESQQDITVAKPMVGVEDKKTK